MNTPPYAIVIEDDPSLGVIFLTTLQQAGFESALDLNGDNYRPLLNSAKPDLVILDLHLPYASGVEILDEIRSKYEDTVIAVVTADIVRAKSLENKADHVLIKPVSVSALLRLAETVKGKYA